MSSFCATPTKLDRVYTGAETRRTALLIDQLPVFMAYIHLPKLGVSRSWCRSAGRIGEGEDTDGKKRVRTASVQYS